MDKHTDEQKLVERVRNRLISNESDATPARVAEALREEGLVLGDSTLMTLVAGCAPISPGPGRSSR